MLRLTWSMPPTSTGSMGTPTQGLLLGPDFCTAGRSSPIKTAMIAITTSNSISVKPDSSERSFLNAVAACVPPRRSIVRSRSVCMSCGTEIAWYDNVPLLSYALLRGRCRSCGIRIPLRYPLVELVTALLLAGCVWKFGVSADAAVAALFCATLVAVSATDIEHGIVPNRVVLPVAVVVLLAQTALHPSVEWVLAALASATSLFIVALAYPNGLGMGDVKLALLLGAMLGLVVPFALIFAVFAALIPSAFL